MRDKVLLENVLLCVYTCVHAIYVYIHLYAIAYAGREDKFWHYCSGFVHICFMIGSLSLAYLSLISLGQEASKPQVSANPCLPSADSVIRICHYYQLFKHGFYGLNSGLHCCTIKTLLTLLSSQSDKVLYTTFIKDILKVLLIAKFILNLNIFWQ